MKRTSYAGLEDSARYVGMKTCASCHPAVHSTFTHTGMGESFDRAGTAKSAGTFNENIKVTDTFKQLNYHPFWKDDNLYFKEFRMSGTDTSYSRTEQVAYIVGSGQHTNSHMWESNQYLFQAPMTFYTQKQTWDLPPGFEAGNNSRFNRKIGLECMTCHNAYPEFVPGSENKFKKVESGIDCERCHGPGSIHVKEKSMGILIDTAAQIDYSIVNPSKLPIDLQFDLCQRCHIQGNAVLNSGKSFFDFKPGMQLSEVMFVFMPVYRGNDDEHIMASHAERLKLSKCFTATKERLDATKKDANEKPLKPYKDGLTCITCHNPHVSVKTVGDDHFNTSCRNCHQAGKDPLCSNDIVVNARKNNDCVSCHMPMNGTTDIPHVSVHDHKISIHQERKDIERMKTFIGINCINNGNPPGIIKAQAYINYVEKFGMDKSLLDSALNLVSQQSPPEIEKNIHQLVQIYYLKSDFKNVVYLSRKLPSLLNSLNRKSYDNKDAWTSYRVGESMQNYSSSAAALPWFKNAFRLAPFNPEFGNKYANALAATNKMSEARRIFVSLVNEHPYFAPAYCNLAYLILVQEADTKTAHQLLDKALALDPDYEPALMNKAATFIAERKNDDAILYLKKVLKINPYSMQAIEGLKRLRNI